MSNLTLYASPILNKQNHFCIDDFSSYLSNIIIKTTISSFQYIRPLRVITLKLDSSQVNAEPVDKNSWTYNYLALNNLDTNSRTFYYFITNVVQKASKTIELTCEMDVLNTFTWNTDYIVNKRTLVKREHKDRFYSPLEKARFTIGSAASSIIVGNYYALSLDYLFNNAHTFKGYHYKMYIYKNNQLYMTLPNTILTVEYRVQEQGALTPNPYMTFRRYDNIAHTYSDAIINIYKYEKDDFKVLMIADSDNQSQLNDEIVTLLDVSDFEPYKQYTRKVDLMSEGINASVFHNVSASKNIVDKLDISWSLYYKNRNLINENAYNEVNPVDCYLIPSSPIDVKYNSADGEIERTDISSGHYWIFFQRYNEPEISFDIDGKVYSPRDSYPSPRRYNTPPASTYPLAFYNDGTHLIIYQGTFTAASGFGGVAQWIEIARDPTLLKVINPPEGINYRDATSLPNRASIYNDALYLPVYGASTFTLGTYQNAVTLSEQDIDRTLAENIKIIRLPYCPTSFDVVNDVVEFGGEWEYNSGDKNLKLVNNSVMFKNSFLYEDSPLKNLIYEMDLTPSSSDLRNDDLESKLFHSDYYRPKFVYDSFSLVFEYEKVDADVYTNAYEDEPSFPIDFIMTRNIVSKFAFIFPQYVCKYATEDYPNVAAVARNNEEVLYNSQYINYLRTGYNYDLKAKQRSEVAGGAGVGLSLISTLAGIIGGIASENYLMAGVSAVVGIASIAKQSVSYAKSVADAEQNIAQKLQEKQNQSVSISNADDIDLLEAYSNNRAKMSLYEASPLMKKALADMFYYAGYASNEKKIPSINTRYWFNYLECDLVLNKSSSYGDLTEELKNELIKLFSEGVTFFHHHSTWDLQQSKENYESWILE